jgi:uncharacterized protein (UPF0548 family)
MPFLRGLTRGVEAVVVVMRVAPVVVRVAPVVVRVAQAALTVAPVVVRVGGRLLWLYHGKDCTVLGFTYGTIAVEFF